MNTYPGWVTLPLLLGGLVAVALSVLVLGALLVGTKSVRAARALRRRRHLEPYRQALLDLATGEPEEGTREQLAQIPVRSRAVVLAAVLELLDKVKGEPAADLVGVLADHDAVTSARRAMTSHDPVARGRAALVLGRTGTAAALADLTRLVGDDDELVRQAAVTALGHLGDPAGAMPILAAVRSVAGRPGVPTGVAVDALLDLGYGIEHALVWGMRDPDAGIRAVAARTAAERTTVATRQGVRDLLLAEAEPQVQVDLCRALGRMGGPEDVPALASAAGGGAPARRRAAAAALGELDVPAAVPRLAALLDDDDRRLAGAAAEALGAMTCPSAWTALTEATGRAAEAASFVVALGALRAEPVGAVRA